MEKQPIRILHVIGSMGYGGAETLIMSLYRNIDRTRVQFDFVENTMKEAAFDNEIRSLGGRIFNCPHYTLKNHFAYIRWWRSFFREHAQEYTAVHGHIGSTAVFYLHEANKHGLFTIAHSHNTRGVGFSDFLYRIYAFPTRFIADQFFACSRQAGIDRYGKKVGSDPQKCILIHNAIDTKRFAFDPKKREDARNALNYSKNDLVIGHIGRFVTQKNHPFLIDVFAEVLRREPNAKLLLLGLEDPEQAIRKKAERLGLTDSILFAGLHRDTVPYYHAMDAFVLPSLFEGFGIVNIEAQCNGLPCVISDKVSTECILAKDLVSVCSLDDGPEKWAKRILEVVSENRFDHSMIIADLGYDVRQTAASLEEFYREKAGVI